MDHHVVELAGGDIVKPATIQRDGKYKPNLNRWSDDEQIPRTDELLATAHTQQHRLRGAGQ